MNGAIDRRALLSRIEERLEALVDENQRGLGRRLGKSGQTMGRWKGDLDQWEGRPLLNIAAEDEVLGGLVVAYVRNQSQTPTAQGEAVAVIGDLMDVAKQGGESISHICSAIGDGRVSPDEAADVDRHLAVLSMRIEKARSDLAAQRMRQ